MNMDSSIYKKFFEVEEKMWWFKARKNIIESFLKKIVLNKQNKLLDFGAGTGILSLMMSNYANVTAVDNHEESIKYSYFSIKLIENLSSFEPLEFDVITAFDVLEHCDDDVKIINDFYKILKTGGYVFVTVPAYQKLWSYHDEIVHHRRRYNRGELKSKFELAGFEIVRSSYFNSLLFPFFVLNILFNRFKVRFLDKKDDTVEMPPSFINTILFKIFNLEEVILQKYDFYWGSSLMLIARKNN
jgi:SAM-dependent methyltransferase